MDITHEVSLGWCVQVCHGSWLKYAEEIMKNNKLHPVVFGTAVKELITLECGKYRNIIIVGPSNCGKTFLLKLLESVFKNIFQNQLQINMLGLELTMLRSFFWIISHGLLRWLSGKVCCYYLKVTRWGYQRLKIIFHVISKKRDSPVFVTSKCEITLLGKYSHPTN